MEFTLSKEELAKINHSECEEVLCQDHEYRIYSNILDAYMVYPTFKSEDEAARYRFSTADIWDDEEDIDF